MDYLFGNSICITDIRSVWPRSGDSNLDLEEETYHYEGCYTTQGQLIAFICDSKYYVAPYTHIMLLALEKNGLMKEIFAMPRVDLYIDAVPEQWDKLQKQANEINLHDDMFVTCESYCDEQGIGEISKEALSNCFKVPIDGVAIRHCKHCEALYFPEVLHVNFIDNHVIGRIGRYAKTDKAVAFVYRDGFTYVTKGLSIIKELKAAGYREAVFHVPFQNGEEIIDPVLKDIWSKIISK